MTAATSIFHHRMIGLIVVVMGLADFYGLHPCAVPLALVGLGVYGWTFQFNGPEDVTHRVFSSLAIAGGIYEGWRRSGDHPQVWAVVSQGLLLLAASFLLFHRHAHHQTLFVTIHHTLFAAILLLLAWNYHHERYRGMTVTVAGVILLFYFID